MQAVRAATMIVLALIAPIAANAETVFRGDRAVVTLVAVGEADGNATIAIEGADLAAVRGDYFMGLKTRPRTGIQAPSAWTGLLEDASGMDILVVPTRSATAHQVLPGHLTLGVNWPILDRWTLTLTGIGVGKAVICEFVFN